MQEVAALKKSNESSKVASLKDSELFQLDTVRKQGSTSLFLKNCVCIDVQLGCMGTDLHVGFNVPTEKPMGCSAKNCVGAQNVYGGQKVMYCIVGMLLFFMLELVGKTIHWLGTVMKLSEFI